MTKLAAGGSESVAGDGLFAMLASYGVLLCMIFALMGIKLWWFKHRLSFDQSRTSNAEAGRATPIAPLRTRSSREKRISQEIQEPVEVHGSFRRREENDLDIVPTKELPPVRIRNFSQSTPALFPLPPPRRANRVRSAIYEEYNVPPTREPPIPPIESPQPPTPTMSLAEEMPTFDELKQKYRQMEIKEESTELKRGSNESLVCMRDTPPQPPKRLNRHSYNEEKVRIGMHKFMKVKLRSTELTQSLQNVNERRATGFLKTGEENTDTSLASSETQLSELHPTRSHSVEEFGERRPTGYIKYEEIDTDDLADFRQKWESLQTSFGAPSPISFQSTEHIYGTLNDHDYDHINQARAAASHAETQNWLANERFVSNNATPVSQTSVDFTSDEEFSEELGGFQATPYMVSAPQSTNVTPSSSNAKLTDNVQIQEVPLRQKIRPEQLWNELEANIKQDDHEKRLWHEIENDLDFNRDFASNIEEEFNRIRHSYEENEAGILENNCHLKRIPKQVLIFSPEPEGFGKTIDEDWASFENLPKNQLPSELADEDRPVAQFNLSDLEDAYDHDVAICVERRPIDLVRSNRKFIRELSKIEDEEEPTSPIHNASKELSFLDDGTSIQQFSVTENASPELRNMNEDYLQEHNKSSIFEPAAEPLTVETQACARARLHQKVSFDFTNTEYIQANGVEKEGDEDEDEDNEEQSASTDLLLATKHGSSYKDLTVEGPTQTVPKPMQRITKIHHTTTQSAENNITTENEISMVSSRTSSPAPGHLLSMEEIERDMNGSWTAIRQQREITMSTSTSPCSIPLTYISFPQSPMPAYRSPVPEQAATDPSVTLTEVKVITEHYVSSIKPHAAARKQYLAHNEYNATEA